MSENGKIQTTKNTDNESLEIKSVNDAVDIGTKNTYCFFRGQPKRISGHPLPRIFRKTYNERSVMRDFIRVAPGLSTNVPEQTEYVHWLFLMQHHGTPTRLLDWTESVLTALFFAVYDKDPITKKDDAEILQISIYELNKVSGLQIPPVNNPYVEYLAREPIELSPEGFAKRAGLKFIPQWPIAIYPPLFWGRMVAQKSVFTIHPKPSATDKVFPKEAELTRYLIKAENKPILRKMLTILGIDLFTLFPDLDALSEEIEYRYGG